MDATLKAKLNEAMNAVLTRRMEAGEVLVSPEVIDQLRQHFTVSAWKRISDAIVDDSLARMSADELSKRIAVAARQVGHRRRSKGRAHGIATKATSS